MVRFDGAFLRLEKNITVVYLLRSIVLVFFVMWFNVWVVQIYLHIFIVLYEENNERRSRLQARQIQFSREVKRIKDVKGFTMQPSDWFQPSSQI